MSDDPPKQPLAVQLLQSRGILTVQRTISIVSSKMCCYCLGEFGVVYKAEYTIPTEEGGYEIVTVAVKTLKGRVCCGDGAGRDRGNYGQDEK